MERNTPKSKVKFFIVSLILGAIVGAVGGIFAHLVFLLLPGLTETQRSLVIPLCTLMGIIGALFRSYRR